MFFFFSIHYPVNCSIQLSRELLHWLGLLADACLEASTLLSSYLMIGGLLHVFLGFKQVKG